MKHIELGELIRPGEMRRAGQETFPVLSMTMRDGLVDQAEKFKKRVASADTSAYKVVERNQLVVGFPIDEGVLAFQHLYDEAIVSPAYNIWDLQSDVLIDNKYLEQFLRSPRALAFYRSKLRSTTARRRSLPNDVFLSLSVPVPSLTEQKRIVMMLNEADDLRKLRTQADRRTAAILPALFYEMFGDPAMNQLGMPVVRLGELCETSPSYGTMIPARAEGGEWLTLRVANIQDGLLDLADQKFVNLPDDMLKRYTVKDGDLLLARAIGSRDQLGKCIVVNPGSQKWAFDSHLMRVQLDHRLCEAVWLKTLLDTPGGRHLFLSNTRQSAVQFNINSKEFADIAVPLPPLPLQKLFAERVSKVRNLEDVQVASRRRLDDLFQSMLHHAFAGEL